MFNSSEYAEMVRRLSKPGEDILKSLTPYKCHLLHMAIGVSSDSGELLDAIKKHVIYGKPLDLENVIEELGDIEFFLQGIRNALDISRDDVLRTNCFKLGKRYAEGYSDRAAQERKDKL